MKRLAVLAVLVGCGEEWLEATPREVCDQVGYSIAARTMACEDDPELAIERQERVGRQWRCIAEGAPAPIEDYYHCPVAINELSCPEVRELGDDLQAWLEVSSACDYVLEPKGAR